MHLESNFNFNFKNLIGVYKTLLLTHTQTCIYQLIVMYKLKKAINILAWGYIPHTYRIVLCNRNLHELGDPEFDD